VTRNSSLYHTVMLYTSDSGEPSSVSTSDHELEYGEFDNDNLGSENDKTQSDAPFGENLRVRSLFSLDGLIFND